MLFVDSICRHQKSVDPQKWSLIDGENFFKDALGSDGPRQRRKRCFDRAWIQQCSLLGLEGMLSSKGGRLMLRLMNEDWTALENLGRWVHCCFSSLRRIETINFHLSHGDQDSWRGWNARHCIVWLTWMLADPFEVGGVFLRWPLPFDCFWTDPVPLKPISSCSPFDWRLWLKDIAFKTPQTPFTLSYYAPHDGGRRTGLGVREQQPLFQIAVQGGSNWHTSNWHGRICSPAQEREVPCFSPEGKQTPCHLSISSRFIRAWLAMHGLSDFQICSICAKARCHFAEDVNDGWIDR